jgi:hypothetical protein
MMLARGGSTLPAVFKSESAAFGWITSCVARETRLISDKAGRDEIGHHHHVTAPYTSSATPRRRHDGRAGAVSIMADRFKPL